MEIDGYIDDVRYDLHRLPKSNATLPQQPTLVARWELAAAVHHSG
jgi:hypothetical protein